MYRSDDYRWLTFWSMMAAFVLGAVFGALGTRLRPRVVLAPGLADEALEPTGIPDDVVPVVAEATDAADEIAADPTVEGQAVIPLSDTPDEADSESGLFVSDESAVAAPDMTAEGLAATSESLDTPLEFPDDSLPGNGSNEAPDDYPVKGNHRSGIYHLPGGLAYDRTVATIYFRTAEAAEDAGYRASKA